VQATASRLQGPAWIGANFWSRAGGPRMWTHYDAAVVREELAVLSTHGLNVTRSFCFWPDFMPAPSSLDLGVLERFEDFLDAHVECGLGTIPTFVVGHMSGENWDPPWRQGRDLYRDVWLVSQQAWLAAAIAERFGSHAAVVGWLVSNEMPLYGGPAAADEITAWARIVCQAVRSTGATQPLSLGDGAWGIEVSGQDNGYSLRDLASLVDFVGPHVYPMQDDHVRQALTAAFVCELSGGFGKPVVLEEFGVTSDFVADDNAADYYRQVLHTTLLAGARGWIAWNNCDYDDLANDDPYRHHGFEMHFGLTDRDGKPKPQLRTLEEFSTLVAGLGDDWAPVKGGTVIVVPEHFERAFPFTTTAYRQDIRDNLLQSYVAALEADLPVELVRERDGLHTDAPLVLVPCAKLLTTSGVERLQALAEEGATVFVSYFAGSTTNQRGPWIPWINETFGVRQRLRYGLVDPIVDDVVEFELLAAFGELDPGSTLRFRVGGQASARAFLPVEPDGAAVIASDRHGRPALLQKQHGAGSLVLCTYPIEHLAARSARVNPEDTWRLYSALATEAAVSRPLRVDDPRVIVGRIRHGGGEVAVYVNCSSDEVLVSPIVDPDAELPFPHDPFAMPPFGVATASRAVPSSVAHERTVAAHLLVPEGSDALEAR
jgi:endo-1,4-beta-mannosidase